MRRTQCHASSRPLALAALLALPLACRSEVPATCDPSCAAGWTCLEGTCRPPVACDPPCAEGWTCLEGTCRPPVACDPPCAEGWTCVDGACEPPACPVCPEGEHCQAGACVPDPCEPECEPGWTCRAGACEPVPCQASCPTEERCEAGACAPNRCEPVCAEGERCLAHGEDACACGEGGRCAPAERCLQGACRGACEDGEDGDGDGWTDQDDPDCAVGEAEAGLTAASCNDGLDADGDGRVDAADPDCRSALSDEVLGDGSCQDDCADREDGCAVYDAGTGGWGGLDPAAGLHDRARAYDGFLRQLLLPAGGVANAEFADTTYSQVTAFDGTGDSAIWTGTYLAAQALRARATGAPDATRQAGALVRTLHTWFTISGDPGYLARFAIAQDGDPRALAAFSLTDRSTHQAVGPDARPWYWRGHISRDQYQGVLLGYSLAYEVLADDEPARELIRQDVMALVEQLMLVRDVPATVTVDGFSLPVELELSHSVLCDDEMPGGRIELVVSTSATDDAELWGFQEFMPDVAALLRQVSLLSWLPNLPRPGSALMLASFFQVALQVTDGVPAWAARRQAVASYYEAHADDWLDVAEQWTSLVRCGQSYYGLHIDFLPTYNLGRLETDPSRAARVRNDILHGRLWPAVDDHKNVLFAFIAAALPPTSGPAPAFVGPHLAQLEAFPPPPRAREGRDLTARYPADPDCPGLSSIAVDVGERVVEDYLWQRDPFELTDPERLLEVFPGVDYLVAYWLGRAHGFIGEDSPARCLRRRGPAAP